VRDGVNHPPGGFGVRAVGGAGDAPRLPTSSLSGWADVEGSSLDSEGEVPSPTRRPFTPPSGEGALAVSKETLASSLSSTHGRGSCSGRGDQGNQSLDRGTHGNEMV